MASPEERHPQQPVPTVAQEPQIDGSSVLQLSQEQQSQGGFSREPSRATTPDVLRSAVSSESSCACKPPVFHDRLFTTNAETNFKTFGMVFLAARSEMMLQVGSWHLQDLLSRVHSFLRPLPAILQGQQLLRIRADP